MAETTIIITMIIIKYFFRFHPTINAINFSHFEPNNGLRPILINGEAKLVPRPEKLTSNKNTFKLSSLRKLRIFAC